MERKPVKYKFLHKDFPLGKITTCEKMGKTVNPVAKALCQSTASPFFTHPCGKLLWKNLLRMWKSVSYQQVFRSFTKSPFPVENPASRPSISLPTSPAGALRHRASGISFRLFRTKKLKALRKMLSKNRRAPGGRKNLCEHSTNFSPCINFPLPGDTFPDKEPLSTGGTYPCREK